MRMGACLSRREPQTDPLTAGHSPEFEVFTARIQRMQPQDTAWQRSAIIFCCDKWTMNQLNKTLLLHFKLMNIASIL